MADKIIRFATVGTSAICEQFTASAALVPSLKHTAVYSRREDTARHFAQKTGCEKIYTDLEKLAASSDIDAVYIASPNVFHAPQSRIFLENGKHVLCEKPIATSAQEYLETKAIADSRGLIYMDAMKSCNTAWHGDVKRALGEIGKISLARIDFSQRSTRYDNFMAGIAQNIFEPSLHAGTLMDLGVYCFYAAFDLLGEPETVNAAASFFGNGSDHSGSTILGYGNFSAALTYSKSGQSAIDSEIIGDKGTLKIASISQYIGVTLVKDKSERVIVPMHDKITAMSGEAFRFADFISGKNREEYRCLSVLCEKVLRCMDEVKKQIGIVYK